MRLKHILLTLQIIYRVNLELRKYCDMCTIPIYSDLILQKILIECLLYPKVRNIRVLKSFANNQCFNILF